MTVWRNCRMVRKMQKSPQNNSPFILTASRQGVHVSNISPQDSSSTVDIMMRLRTGACLNMKMTSYQYRYSHYPIIKIRSHDHLIIITEIPYVERWSLYSTLVVSDIHNRWLVFASSISTHLCDLSTDSISICESSTTLDAAEIYPENVGYSVYYTIGLILSMCGHLVTAR